jgi:hypothetical protein
LTACGGFDTVICLGWWDGAKSRASGSDLHGVAVPPIAIIASMI